MTVVSIAGGAQVSAPNDPDPELVEFVEEILARVKAGKVIAIGTAEVEQGGKVAVGFCHKNHYHQLNSGAARLSARLATIETRE